MHNLWFLFSKITFYWKLFSDCCDLFDYLGSIVYLSCFHKKLQLEVVSILPQPPTVPLSVKDNCRKNFAWMIFWTSHFVHRIRSFVNTCSYDKTHTFTYTLHSQNRRELLKDATFLHLWRHNYRRVLNISPGLIDT